MFSISCLICKIPLGIFTANVNGNEGDVVSFCVNCSPFFDRIPNAKKHEILQKFARLMGIAPLPKIDPKNTEEMNRFLDEMNARKLDKKVSKIFPENS